MKTPIFIDLETSLHNTGEDAVGKMSSSPFCEDNFIVHLGMKEGAGPTKTFSTKSKESEDTDALIYELFKVIAAHDPEDVVLVAQNASYDILYLLCKCPEASLPVFLTYLSKTTIWDTMQAEYLLSAQRIQWASLDDLVAIYGGTLKNSRIKEYWEAGISTEDIPEEEIIPYLISDVDNLVGIYEGQVAAAEASDMMELMESQMLARLATTIMEWEGMAFDSKLAVKETALLEKELQATEGRIVSAMKELLPDMPEELINPSSNDQISACLFSGDLSYVTSEPLFDKDSGEPILFKSGLRKGMQKSKNTTKTIKVEGLLDATALAVPTTPSGKLSTSAETLRKLSKSCDAPLLNDLLAVRDLRKQVSTYFTGYRALVWPDGCLHGQLNHCNTKTGRLSSSNPNLQNASKKSTEV